MTGNKSGKGDGARAATLLAALHISASLNESNEATEDRAKYRKLLRVGRRSLEATYAGRRRSCSIHVVRLHSCPLIGGHHH